jgi:hypothetical protein
MKYDFDILFKRLPISIHTDMKNCIQDKRYHPEGSALIHTDFVFNNILKLYFDDKYLPELLVAAIFHDLGKPKKTEKRIVDGIEKISHIKHELASLDYIDEYFDLFSDVTTNKEMVFEIVKYHMHAHLYETGKIKKPGKIQAFEQLNCFKQIIQFTKCDLSYLIQ